MKRGNRKLRAAWLLTSLATAMLIAPTLASASAVALGVNFTWVLIGESTWAAVLTLLWAAYFGANVVEKHTSFLPDHQYNADLDAQGATITITEEEIDGDLL